MADVVKLHGEKALPQGLIVEREGAVATIRLDNPPAHSLSLALIGKLRATLDEVRFDRTVNVIVIASSGKIFCAGHDLKEIRAHRADADGGRLYLEDLFRACSDLMKAIPRWPGFSVSWMP